MSDIAELEKQLAEMIAIELIARQAGAEEQQAAAMQEIRNIRSEIAKARRQQ